MTIVDFLHDFQFFAEALKCLLDGFGFLKDPDNFPLSLLDPTLKLGLEVVFDESAADVGIVFEIEKRSRVHRHKAFEQLLVTIEVIRVNSNVEPLL